MSEKGIRQSEDLGKRYASDLPDAVFCSDLQRSYKTAAIAFSGKFVLIFTDARLRECNYGNITQASREQIEAERPNRINTPFPNGESYIEVMERMKDFLSDLFKRHDNERVLIIGHRATHYGLDHLINSTSLEDLTTQHWEWQPGWSYNFDGTKL